MTYKLEHVKRLIKEGEGLTVEFKKSRNEIPKNLYETVCSFLNRYGGTILLGVGDDGSILGIDTDYISKIKKELVNALNNPQLINPPVYIIPEEIEINDKLILYLHVHESSQVHSTRGQIFDRNCDGDYNITLNTNLVGGLYIRKQNTFTENIIYPYATLKELRPDIIRRVRQMALNRQPGHPWESMNDLELLKSAQLYQTDYQTGKEGLTLAAILLFAHDEVILSVLPFHKTDAICRINDLNRYDDRDDIRTNLIESYDRLMHFTENHLPDKFVLKKDIRISVRNILFREIISNTLVHREYTNPFPAKHIIEKNKVITENASKSHGDIQLHPESFWPFPKNPVIARVFKEIGRADELGSGFRNIHEYYSYYSETKPLLEDKDVFRCTIFMDDLEDVKDIENKESATSFNNTGNVGDNVGDVGDNVGNVGDNVGDVGDNVGNVGDNVGDVGDNVGNVGDNVGDVGDNVGDVGDNVGDVGDNVGDVGDNVGDDILEVQRQNQIILLIYQNNSISSKQISEIIGVSKRTIERDIEKLKLAGSLQRIGKRKGGYWQIITNQ